ncbi:MAG: XRE family transcriptional regulator [Actinomycetota bacterium]
MESSSEFDEKLISQRIKSLRIRNNFTVEKLAKEINMSKAYVSMIERSDKAAPISTLNKIAKALNVDINFLISGKVIGDSKVCFLKKEEQMGNLNRIISSSNCTLYELAYKIEDKKILPFLMEISNAEEQIPFSFIGEAIFFLLEGLAEFNVNEVKYIMKEGDSIYIDTNLPHYAKSINATKNSKFLVAMIVKNSAKSSELIKRNRDIIPEI